MENNYTERSVCSVQGLSSQPIMRYEQQIEELHKLAQKIEEKVSHISVQYPPSAEKAMPQEQKSKLNLLLENIIIRYRYLADSIEN